MTTTTMTAITPASGHPPVIASGADVVASVSENIPGGPTGPDGNAAGAARAQAADVRPILAEPYSVARCAILPHHTSAAILTIRQAMATITKDSAHPSHPWSHPPRCLKSNVAELQSHKVSWQIQPQNWRWLTSVVGKTHHNASV